MVNLQLRLESIEQNILAVSKQTQENSVLLREILNEVLKIRQTMAETETRSKLNEAKLRIIQEPNNGRKRTTPPGQR